MCYHIVWYRGTDVSENLQLPPTVKKIFLKMFLSVYKAMQCHNPKDSNLQFHSSFPYLFSSLIYPLFCINLFPTSFLCFLTHQMSHHKTWQFITKVYDGYFTCFPKPEIIWLTFFFHIWHHGWKTSLRFSMVFFNPSMKITKYDIKSVWPLPSITLPIHYSQTHDLTLVWATDSTII